MLHFTVSYTVKKHNCTEMYCFVNRFFTYFENTLKAIKLQ